MVDRQGKYAIIDRVSTTTAQACYIKDVPIDVAPTHFLLLNYFEMPPWSLVSPASRGIGFALAKQILQTTNAPVVVTARKDLDKTKEELLHGTDISESRLTVLKLDVLGTYLSPATIQLHHTKLIQTS